MAIMTGKADIIHDCQMLTSPRPNFYRALENHELSPGIHTTLPGGVVSSIGQVSAARPKDKAW